MKHLKNIFAGQNAYIVGKGTSLQYLKKEHFKDNCFIITLNQAIIKVEELGLENPTFSMQKDGFYPRKSKLECPDCYKCDIDSVYPKNAILLLHNYYSHSCMIDYPNRLQFTDTFFELDKHDFSAKYAIKIALHFGAKHLIFISCDGAAGSGTGLYIPGVGYQGENLVYKNMGIQQNEFLKALNISHEYFTPKNLEN